MTTEHKDPERTQFKRKRPNPDEEKIPDHFGDASQETPEAAPEHEDVSGEPPPAPDSEDSDPEGPTSN